MTTELSRMCARILLLPSLMIAFGVMIKGYSDVGDGFSAGVIAALGVGMQFLVFGATDVDRLVVSRYAPVTAFIGLFVALLTVFGPVLFGHAPLTHWPPPGQSPVLFGTLEFITAVAFDVGVFLLVFGFGVGTLGAIARAEARMVRSESRRGRAIQARDGEYGEPGVVERVGGGRP